MIGLVIVPFENIISGVKSKKPSKYKPPPHMNSFSKIFLMVSPKICFMPLIGSGALLLSQLLVVACWVGRSA